jgi:hypothetical protein
MLVRLAIPPPRPIARERPQLCPQRRVILGNDRLAPLRRPRLPDIPTRPPLRRYRDGPRAAGPPGAGAAGSPIPRLTSRNAWFSRTWSAAIRCNLAFSASSFFKRFTSSAFIPPNWVIEALTAGGPNRGGPTSGPSFLRGLPLALRAYAFARDAHGQQRRESDAARFIVHPLEVASLLHNTGHPERLVVAGILHDTIEGSPATAQSINARFGADVAAIVAAMTEDETIESFTRAKRGETRPRRTQPICARQARALPSELGDARADRGRASTCPPAALRA